MEEAVGDENFVAMHAPCAPRATCSAPRTALRVPRALLRRSGEYREANRSHIADDSGRSVLTIGSLASQVGSSWHSSPAASAPACSPAAIEVRHSCRFVSAARGLRPASRVCAGLGRAGSGWSLRAFPDGATGRAGSERRLSLLHCHRCRIDGSERGELVLACERRERCCRCLYTNEMTVRAVTWAV